MEQWFGAGLRTSMAVEVEEIVHGSGQGHRKCYYDEEGKDVRLSVPGVRWADLRTIRRGILESLRSSCQEAFDKIYEQILDGRRASMTQHILPTMKTPGVSKKTKAHPPTTCTSPQGQPIPVTPPPPPIPEYKMETKEQESVKESATVGTLPLDTSTTRLRTRNQVKRSVIPPRTSVPRTASSPLLHSQRKRPYPVTPVASSTRRTLRSASVATEQSTHEVTMSPEPCHRVLSPPTKKPATLKKTPTCVTPVSTYPVQQPDNTPRTHGSFLAPTPGNSAAPTDEVNSDNVHTLETKCSGADSDGDVQSDGEWMKRRSGSKRLRSVSLEKMSICDIEAKKMSLCVQSENTPVFGATEDDRDVPLLVDSFDGKEPEVLSNEDLMTASGNSEEDIHVPVQTSQPVSTSDDNMTSGEEMDVSPSNSVDSKTSPGVSDEGTDSSSPTEEATSSPTSQQHQTGTQPVSGLNKTPVLSLKKTQTSHWAFLSQKGISVKSTLLPTEGRPATFLSPKASPRRLEGVEKTTAVINGTTLPLSFLPRNSPQQIQKAASRMARQRKLMEQIQRKKEEEEQRKRDLEEKKMQEIEQRKRRNAERAMRAAENRRQEEEKKLMLRKKAQELGHEELSKKQQKMNQFKAHERKEKTKKHNEHVAAVLARKRQEDVQKAKKLQQIEEDRKMAEELHKQRLEREEEERQTRRAEKLKQERERQEQREAEERERQLNREAEDKLAPEVTIEAKSKPLVDKKHVFQQLLASSSCTVNVPPGASRFISEWKNKVNLPHGSATVTKTNPTLPSTVRNVSLEKCPPPIPHVLNDTTKENISPQTSINLNSTFTVDISSAEKTTKDVLVTPLKSATSAAPPSGDSYKMTPAQPRSSNYDINDLSSGDSTDEEDCPKKPIPSWAVTAQLKAIMVLQEEKVYDRSINPCNIFPSTELLKDVDLARIFKQKRKRFYHRSSSARWDSPVLLKRGKMDGFSAVV